MDRLAGIVLAGGQSRRMGQPKAWLPFGPTSLLSHVCQSVQSVAAPVIVVGAVGQALPELPPGVERVDDPIPEQGPLVGLITGMRALGNRAERVILTSCDAPFLTPAVIAHLAHLLGDRSLAIPFVDGWYHPLTAVYRLTLLPLLEEHQRSGRLALRDLVNQVPTVVVSRADLTEVDPRGWALRNLNTPADYEAALMDRDAGSV